ncbi:MAG: hypothetical protein QW103_01090 [Candidatus Pacearchaeota archaeon]
MILKIKNKGKNIYINCEKTTFLKGLFGLMFKIKNTKNLYFEKAGNIHSLFVFNKFIALWLNEKNEVIRIDLVKPFKFLIEKPKEAKKLIEIPFNEKNKKIINNILNN